MLSCQTGSADGATARTRRGVNGTRRIGQGGLPPGLAEGGEVKLKRITSKAERMRRYGEMVAKRHKARGICFVSDGVCVGHDLRGEVR